MSINFNSKFAQFFIRKTQRYNEKNIGKEEVGY